MLDTNTVIIMPLIHSWNTIADYQKQTATLLSQKNTVIVAPLSTGEFFLKRVTRYTKKNGVIFHTPIYLLPFKRFPFITAINNRLSFSLFVLDQYIRTLINKKSLLLWYFSAQDLYPHRHVLATIPSLYDCVDDVGWLLNKKKNMLFRKQEAECIKNSTYFFVNSRTLEVNHRTVRKPTARVPQGFAVVEFAASMPTQKIAPSKNKVGYVGHINFRIDWSLLIHTALKAPSIEFHLYGPIMHEPDQEKISLNKVLQIVKKVPNVFLHPQFYNRREVVKHINSFTVAMIPYDTTLPANKNCFPMKFLEYLYCEKPVISTKITELQYYKKYATVSNSPHVWATEILSLCKNPIDITGARAIAKSHSWEKKVNKICSHL